MAARSPGSSTFTKVKGHAKDMDVQRGHVLACDKLGNDGADEWACAGADQHAISEALLSDVRFRKMSASGVQKMMLEILRVRRQSEQALAHAADDLEPAHEMVELDSSVDCENVRIPSDSG